MILEDNILTVRSDSKEAIPRLLFVDNQVTDFLQYRMVLATALKRSGFDVHVALPKEPGTEEIERQGIPVHSIYLRRLSIKPLDELLTLISLIRLYRRLRPSVVHHLCLKPTLHGGIAAQIAGVPLVVSTLTGLGPVFSASRTLKMHVLRRIVAIGLRLCFSHPRHCVIVQNQDDRNFLTAHRIAPADRIVIIRGSGVDLSSFTPRPEPVGPPVVLMATRLLWEKGVQEFVSAASTLRARGIQARFVLLGEPDHGHPSAIELSALQSWHSSGVVEWLGWQSDMPARLSQSHIVCLPSYYGEGIPRVLLEAAASGRPIITTDSAGCREVVRQDWNGLLVPPRDAAALARAIARLVEDASLRESMGARSHEIAVNEFSQDHAIQANLEVYRSLLSMNEQVSTNNLSSLEDGGRSEI